jgi:uncharacterized protein YybS (DUF2232 family)
MYISDKNALEYASRIILVLVPLLSSLFDIWSWAVEILILLAVFAHYRRSGLRLTGILLAIGYLAAVVPLGADALVSIGFSPWAGIVFLGLKEKKLRIVHCMFWGLIFVALVNALPVIPVVHAAMQPEAFQSTIHNMLDFYQQAGVLPALEKNGITSADFEKLLEKSLPAYYKVLPGISGIIGMLELGIAYLIYRLPLKKIQKTTPYWLWQLPWYAVWVAIVGLAGYLGGDYLGAVWLATAGLNVMVMTAGVLLVTGFCCLAFFLKHPKTPRLLLIVLIFVGAYFPFILLLGLVTIGLFDLVFNFRKIPEKNEEGRP